MEPITFEDYVNLSADLTNREKFRAYSTVIPGEGGFDFQIVPNPDLVIMTEEQVDLEDAMQIGNDTERAARKVAFLLDRGFNPDRPVVVSEGDSWFQFPVLIDDVIDHLNPHYAILSLGAAGDTTENMVRGNSATRKKEYLFTLKRYKNRVRAFLFSGAGNDFLGQDERKKPSLLGILREYNGKPDDIEGHINQDELKQRIDQIRSDYQTVINDIRGIPELQNLPILFHGYDYAYPFPWGTNDKRNPRYLKSRDQWLGSAFKARKFPTSSVPEIKLRRAIIMVLVNRLYDLLEELADADPNVHVVDCRDTLLTVSDWNDEIHGTSRGFARIASRFKDVLDKVI